MEELTLKVSTEEMLRQADAIKTSVENIRKQFESISGKIEGTRYYWEGDAENLHLSRFKELQSQCQEITARLKTHPDNLMKMAGIYTQSESQSTAQANSLPGGILV